MRQVCFALGLPRPPHRSLLLRDPDQHHPALTAVPLGSLDQRASQSLLVLTLDEPMYRHSTGLRPLMDLGHIAIADLPERRRRRDLIATLPAQELTHPAHRLQLRHISLQQDPIHRSARERDMVSQ
jgi:hypothetical protein